MKSLRRVWKIVDNDKECDERRHSLLNRLNQECHNLMEFHSPDKRSLEKDCCSANLAEVTLRMSRRDNNIRPINLYHWTNNDPLIA